VNTRTRWLALLLSTTGLSWALQSCAFTLAADRSLPAPSTATSPASALWANDFSQSDWQTPWQIQEDKRWGDENRSVISTPGDRFPQILRVRYPRNSASPTVHRTTAAPLGGTQFYAKLGLFPQDSLRLSYYVRFSENFDFVKGGKLPGLFGGTGNNGGDIPDGEDGFSTRFMWRSDGEGEVYAYLPTSREHGTSIGRGSWSFRPNTWYHLEQEVTLNHPGEANGRLRVWVDNQIIFDRSDLTFRSVETLQIEGILFSTFFGGGDRTWATPHDVYADFADFTVTAP
jgi:hypothetical protein